MKKIIYYSSFDKDIVESKNQNYLLKDSFKWLHKNIFYKILTYIVYYLVLIIAFIYSKLILHIKIVGKNKLNIKTGYFIYSNHTQILGDVLNPFIINFPKKPHIICSSANLGIPIIGKILPIAGAIPIPNDIHRLINMNEAIKYHSKKHPIIIYPESHLWPYYTKIRPFNKSSFYYPIDNNLPTFVSTTTYQKKHFLKRPKITIYIDGPYYKEEPLSRKENIKSLHNQVSTIMEERSKLNNYEYITYKKKTN